MEFISLFVFFNINICFYVVFYERKIFFSFSVFRVYKRSFLKFFEFG